MRRMTEAKAWIEAAKEAQTRYLGLCYPLGEFVSKGRISHEQHARMKNRIIARANRIPLRYRLVVSWIWPIDHKGQKQRTAWAKRQAEIARRAKR